MQFFLAQTSGTYYRPSFLGGFTFFPPVIKTLLISNTLLWLLTGFIPLSFLGIPLEAWVFKFFALVPLGGAMILPGMHADFYPWQLVTYMFLHGGFAHLFFNMLALWMFGMELENTWGSRKFLIYYALCGLGAAMCHLFVTAFLGQAGPTVGASGAVFGVLVAFGIMFPDRPIYIYFLLPIRAKYFVAFYMAMELFHGVFGTSDGVAHFAHLGGAAVGLLYVLVDRGMIPGGSWLRGLRGRREQENWGYGRFNRTPEEVHEAKFYDIKSGQQRKGGKDITQEDIDAILDKISAGGYQSLTDEEKRILFEASKKIH